LVFWLEGQGHHAAEKKNLSLSDVDEMPWVLQPSRSPMPPARGSSVPLRQDRSNQKLDENNIKLGNAAAGELVRTQTYYRLLWN
jgi:hypothetical protein